MVDSIITILANVNWQTIIGMFAIGWYFSKDLTATIVKLENDISEQGKRTDNLYEMFCKQQKEFHEEMKNLRVETDKKFYDLLKAGMK